MAWMKLSLLALVPTLALAQVTASVQTQPLSGGPITTGDDTALWVLADGGAVVLVTNSASNQMAGVNAYHLVDGTFISSTVDGPAVAVDVRYGLPFDGGTTDVVLGVRNDGTFALYNEAPTGLLSHLTLAASMGTQLQPSAGALVWRDDDLFIFVGSFTGELQQWRVDVSGASVTFTKVAERRLGTRAIKALAGDELHDRLLVSMAGAGLGQVTLDPNVDGGFKVIDKEDGGSLGISPAGIGVYPVNGGNGGVILVSDNAHNQVAAYVGDQLNNVFKIGQNGTIPDVRAPLGVDVLTLAQPMPFQLGTLAVVDSVNNNGGPNAKLVPWAAIASLSDALPTAAFDPRTLPHHKEVPVDGGCGVTDGGADGGADAGSCTGAGGGGGTGGIHIGPNPGMPYEDHRCGCGNFGAVGGALWLLGLALRRKKS